MKRQADICMTKACGLMYDREIGYMYDKDLR
jgi:hypothetical protein